MSSPGHRYLALSVLSLSLATPAFAHDEHIGADHNQIHGVRIDIHGSLDPYSVVGVGGRVEFAIVPNGFIRGHVKDELALSFGAELFFAPTEFGWNYYTGGVYTIPIGAVQWNFYLGDHWSVFPELGVAVRVDFGQDGWTDRHGHGYSWLYPQVDAGIGARYHFNDNVALLLRASTPGGLQVGVVF